MPSTQRLCSEARHRFSILCLIFLLCALTPTNSLPADSQTPVPGTGSARIVFEGNQALSETSLRSAAQEELADFEGLGGRESDIDDAAYQMEAVYRKAGFPFAVVDYRIEKEPGKTVAVFEIQEREQVLLSELRIEGNTVFDDKELKALIENGDNLFPASGKRVFVEADFLDAVPQIQRLYRGRGYLDASVQKPEVQFTDQNTRATVIIRIEENQKYVISEISYGGDLIESAAAGLERVRKELTGQPFNPRQRFAIEKRIEQIYGNLGYADVTVQIESTAGEPPNNISLAAQISSGPRVTISAIEITGNERTRQRFIRSRLLLKPGDTFGTEKMQASFRELYRTGLFSSVDISLKGAPDENQRILLVSVSEAPAKEVYVEPGWGSYERLRVKFGFREANLLGTGRIFDASTKVSVKAQGVGVSLVDPWFLNRDITAEIPLSYERREEPSFTREDISAAFLLTKQLSEYITVTGGYKFTRTSISDVEPSEFIDSDDEDYDLGSLTGQIGYDTRNDIFFPTQGQKSFLSVEYADDLLGGNVSFVRLAGGLRYFLTLRRGTVLAARYSTGMIIPGPNQIGVPIGERFFKGGENTVRSFEEGQLGPKDSSNDPVGGMAFNVISVELRQQLVNRLTASLFVDLGNIAPNRSREEQGKPPYDSRSEIWDDTLSDFFSDFRPAVGVGLQYLLPFGPARLDFAFNPDRDTKRDEDLFVWHFSIGMAF